jgi:hypothetical protein
VAERRRRGWECDDTTHEPRTVHLQRKLDGPRGYKLRHAPQQRPNLPIPTSAVGRAVVADGLQSVEEVSIDEDEIVVIVDRLRFAPQSEESSNARHD